MEQLSEYTKYKAKNCSRSVDAHFQNGAVTVSVFFLPIKVANTLVMHNSKQISFPLLYLND